MQNNKISVIVPVYNVLPYIEKCINSLICQTYKNLEIILVDDGSCDGSGEICDKYAQKYKNIIVFHKNNEGLSSARNVGLVHVTGDYIGFVDSDDYIEQDMYEKMLQTMNNSKSDMCVCSFVREKENSQRHVVLNDFDIQGLEYFKLFADKESMPYVVIWNKLFKVDLLKGLKFPEDKIHEDQWVIHYIVSRAKKISLISSELYHYTDRINGLSKGSDFSKHFDDYDALFDRIEFLKKMNYIDLLKYCDEHLFNISHFYIGQMYNSNTLKKDILNLKEYFKKCLNFSNWCLKNNIIDKKVFLSRKKFYNFNFIQILKLKIKRLLKYKKIK